MKRKEMISMMCSWERDQLLKIVDKLVNVYHLAKYYQDYAEKKWSLTDWLNTTHVEEALDIVYCYGATKGVFIIPDLDWVIKFTLIGEKHDWCNREYENYIAAEEAGLDYYFAEMVYLKDCGNIIFYAQERVECDESVDSSIVDKLQARYDSRGECYDMDSLWNEVEDELDTWERLDLLYGNEELCEFVKDHRINDLHCGNFGIKGDHYVIIDYSGYGRAVWGG